MKISCVICAYNEAPRIGAVLAVAAAHPLIDEVIVVDDGSTDGTADVIRSFPTVHLLSVLPNRGKSSAMASGIGAARHELLLLLDADLKGLDADNITALIEPVSSGRVDVSMSLRRNSLLVFRMIGLDFVSGERVVRKELLSAALAEMHGLPRFGIEVFMNQRIISRALSIAVVRWARVTQARKTEKVGYWRGIRAEWRMMADMLKVIYPMAAISQTWRMLLLRARDKPLFWRSRETG